MDSSSPIQVVEQFHLLFLAQLGRRLDKKFCVLKGGCNLRFFHQSVRLSEDLDLDVFDLHHLIAGGAGVKAISALDPQEVDRATANALAINFAAFRSQVLAYLPPEDQIHFDSTTLWDALVLEVVGFLRGTGP